MNRYYFFATLALFAMVAMGCTREKPAGPDTASPPIITILSTPVPVVTTSAAVNTTIAPATGITSTTAITVPTDTSAVPASPTPSAPSSASPTPSLALPPGVFSQPPPLVNPTTSAPSVSIAATSTPNAPVAPLTSGPTTYTVQWGDWLSKIARQFGVTNEAILAANPRMNPNLLFPGQVLNIPGPGGTNPTPSGATPTTTPGGGPTTYTVQRGDWFYAIARKFGVTVEALQAANPGVNPNIVYPGQVLNIPGSGPTPGATNTPPTGGATPTASPTGTSGGKPSRYTVQAGDTLYSIALRFNTTIYALQIANHLASPHFIYPGQVLVIPK